MEMKNIKSLLIEGLESDNEKEHEFITNSFFEVPDSQDLKIWIASNLDPDTVGSGLVQRGNCPPEDDYIYFNIPVEDINDYYDVEEYVKDTGDGVLENYSSYMWDDMIDQISVKDILDRIPEENYNIEVE
jgi:hypothetical protein